MSMGTRVNQQQNMFVVYLNQCLGAAHSMEKIIQSSFPPSPNFDRITLSFDKLNNTDLFLQ